MFGKISGNRSVGNGFTIDEYKMILLAGETRIGIHDPDIGTDCMFGKLCQISHLFYGPTQIQMMVYRSEKSDRKRCRAGQSSPCRDGTMQGYLKKRNLYLILFVNKPQQCLRIFCPIIRRQRRIIRMKSLIIVQIFTVDFKKIGSGMEVE